MVDEATDEVAREIVSNATAAGVFDIRLRYPELPHCAVRK
jgi:hypothetical protein